MVRPIEFSYVAEENSVEHFRISFVTGNRHGDIRTSSTVL